MTGTAHPVRLAVIGAGLIGRRHAEHVAGEPGTTLAAVVDPSPAGREEAQRLGAPWFASLAEMLAADRPEGVIIATPNQLHVAGGLEAVAAGIPAIVEKPLADDLAGAARLVAAAEKAGVPLLTGHHRRYNPMIARAKEIVESGRLGRVLALHGPGRQKLGKSPHQSLRLRGVDLMRDHTAGLALDGADEGVGQ